MFKKLYTLLIIMLGAQCAAADGPIDDFPYPLIAVEGSQAFQEWNALRSKAGTPIILGSREEVDRILDAFDPSFDDFYDPVEVVLAKATTHQHPASLYEHRTAEFRSLTGDDPDSEDATIEYDPLAIPEDFWGPWPELDAFQDRLISLDDWETGLPHDVVYITVLPTENPWEAPAYLRFGDWNANPPPDIHVAAFRAWADDFGAVPVVMQSDVVEMYVARPPNRRAASRALAFEQYIYCSDIVDQGVGELSILAALLDQSTFWYFWWD